MQKLKIIKFFISILILSVVVSCSTKKAVQFRKNSILPGNPVGIIIDANNNLKNVVLVKFLQRGYNVKAVNASDFYSMNDIFDIKDLKRLSFNGKADKSIVSMEKTYNNIFKLHEYNFEVNKAELLNELKDKWGIQYLILLDLKKWQKVSWGRAIDLRNNQIIWVENYPTKFTDNLETIVNHFIDSMSGTKRSKKKK